MNSNSSKVSFELFPPKTAEGLETLKATIIDLNQANPKYYSITYGAGGSTQNSTQAAVKMLKHEFAVDVAPHITCIGTTKQQIREMLKTYVALGVKQVVVLRGDLPSGFASFDGDFKYAADLVGFLRNEVKSSIEIKVGAYPECHPQAKDLQQDLQNFKAKVEKGADKAITQYFYTIDAYRHFVKQCRKMGVTVPIIPGIMPITNLVQLSRFSKMCGAEIPQWIVRQLQAYGDDMLAIKAFGIEVVTQLCEQLLAEGAEELHFYTLNKAEPSLTIMKNLFLI